MALIFYGYFDFSIFVLHVQRPFHRKIKNQLSGRNNLSIRNFIDIDESGCIFFRVLRMPTAVLVARVIAPFLITSISFNFPTSNDSPRMSSYKFNLIKIQQCFSVNVWRRRPLATLYRYHFDDWHRICGRKWIISSPYLNSLKISAKEKENNK